MAKLLYKPIYNPNLDRLWDGKRGSSKHGGLHFPLRYGLTRKHVEQIIAAGQWKQFITEWTKQKREYLRKQGLGCYVCDSISTAHIRVGSVYLCARCRQVIDHKMLRSIPSNRPND